MITTRERPDQSNRVFRIALLASLIVHLVIGFLAYRSSEDLRHILAHLARPTPQPTNEVVTLSTALRIEKRAKARPPSRPARVAASHPERPTPAVVPRPQSPAVPVAVPQPAPARTPAPPAPSLEKHELAKTSPHGTPEPPKTTVEKIVTTTPTAPPAKTPPPTETPATAPPTQVATIEHHPESPSRPATFSDAQLAQIQHDLAKTIVQSRVENNPLSNVRRPVVQTAAPHHYTIDFSALAGDMREAEGLCDPLRGWQTDGWDYYWATCTIQEPDGTVTRKPMPWPVRWRPRDDPWNGDGRVASGPMPLPPPGWRPDRAIDPDFIPYLRAGGYPI